MLIPPKAGRCQGYNCLHLIRYLVEATLKDQPLGNYRMALCKSCMRELKGIVERSGSALTVIASAEKAWTN